MTNTELTAFFERDIRKLIEEINQFKNEEDLWKTCGTINNSAGNLALHIIGGTSYLIGTTLTHTGYVRHRDKEGATHSYVLTQLLLHLNYHLGQVNYLRRALENSGTTE